jgi:hypothetical protein
MRQAVVRAVFDRYDITSEADLEAAAEAMSRYVAEMREVGPSVVPIASNSDKLSDRRVQAS